MVKIIPTRSLWLCAQSTYLSRRAYLGAKLKVHITIKSAFSTDRAQKTDAASYAARTTSTSHGAVDTTSFAGHFVILLPPPVTGRIEEYDGYNGGPDAD
jgi:hypothetical protein